MAQGTARRGGLRAALPLLPGYLWLTLAIFLPLSAMVWFSFLSDLSPLAGRGHLTLENYVAFFGDSLYPRLLGKSLWLGVQVTF